MTFSGITVGVMDILKSTILAGFGAAAITRDKVKKTLQRLVDEGRVSADEAEKLADEMMEEGRGQWENIQTKINQSLRRALDGMDLASRMRQVELEDRVLSLEKRLVMLEDRIYGEDGGCED